ncbi:tyrosine-type recombinase/integrase [Paraburkholderia elongata]|uniref:tyrosine-type recombinase/integrase n=1 Tax=Paraburkholderia elongata TaxID=2675747 RepID=UPI002E2DFEAC|nr:site-specific integrase [Paraburkholderia elongata]
MAKVNLLDRLAEGRFLSVAELNRLASAAQYRVQDLDADAQDESKSNVIHIARMGLRRKSGVSERQPVDVGTQASRLRYIADFLAFISDYVGSTLPKEAKRELKAESEQALTAFREHVPPVSRRAKLNSRVGLSQEEEDRLVSVVHPDSPDNPWDRGFVRQRNWLIVVLLLATGMRRGELLGLQIGDLHPSQPKLLIIRRADAVEDPRRIQPNTKTYDREIELTPAIMRKLWSYINKVRRKIKAARAIPQVIVSDEGAPLSQASIDKIFAQLREACPGLPVTLTSHVMRHTWNERFSEQAETMGLTDAVEEKARNSQQGWSDNSKMAAIYTRRHTAKKGREISLKLQERLDDKLDRDK